MSSEIKQAADALIAAIEAAIQRILGVTPDAAEEQFYAGRPARMEERIAKACFQVKRATLTEEQAHASRMWADQRLAEAKVSERSHSPSRAGSPAGRAGSPSRCSPWLR